MNGVRCLICKTVVVSTHRHDFRGCKCPPATQVCVDGGADYKKRAFSSASLWDELTLEELEAWKAEQVAKELDGS